MLRYHPCRILSQRCMPKSMPRPLVKWSFRKAQWPSAPEMEQLGYTVDHQLIAFPRLCWPKTSRRIQSHKININSVIIVCLRSSLYFNS